MDLCLDFQDAPEGAEFAVMQVSNYEPHQFVVMKEDETLEDVGDKFSSAILGKAVKADG